MPPPKIQCDILIDDCTLLNKDFKIEEHKSVAVKNGIIEEVGQSSAMSAKYKAAQLLSGENKLLMPGFVDGHTHVCQQLLRGRAGGCTPSCALASGRALREVGVADECRAHVR